MMQDLDQEQGQRELGYRPLTLGVMVELTKLMPASLFHHTIEIHHQLEKELEGVGMTHYSGPLLAHAVIVDCPTCILILKQAGCCRKGAVESLAYAQVPMTQEKIQHIVSII